MRTNYYDRMRKNLSCAIIKLAFFVVIVQIVSLYFEVKLDIEDRFQILLKQVLNMTDMYSQREILASLQKDLAIIAKPWSSSLPFHFVVNRSSDLKLLADIRTDYIQPHSPFHIFTKTKLRSQAYGDLIISSRIDYTKLFFKIVFKTIFNCLLLGFALLVVMLYSKKFHRLRDMARSLVKLESDRKVAELAVQVSHDIRSPLNALAIALSSDIPSCSDIKSIIRNSSRRINNIANNLLKEIKTNSRFKNQNSSPTFLMSLIDMIVSEKKILFQGKNEIQIEMDISQGKGLFTQMDESELARILANLIQNAVESITQSGKIQVMLFSENEHSLIIVKDNGRGIPLHILPRLGLERITHGKTGVQSGTGLGILHARHALERFEGSLEFKSKKEGGTIATIRLPKAEAAPWYIDEISLHPNTMTVLFDNEESSQKFWQTRIENLRSTSESKIEDFRLKTLSSQKEFEQIIQYPKTPDSHLTTLFLVNLDLFHQLGYSLTTLSRIEGNNQTILITDDIKETEEQLKEKELSFKILPRIMTSHLALCCKTEKRRFDAILIDDDVELVHSCWKLAANQNGKSILTFSEPQEFFAQADRIESATPLYIDVHLSGGWRGEEVAQEAFSIGFSNINLATGCPPSSLTPPQFIKQVVEKIPPFLSYSN